jgi:hypothetical protein
LNFVSHYYCAKEANPYYTLGVLFPDIFKKFSFYHNQFFTKFDPALLTEKEAFIWRGIEQHYSDDGYFHAFPEFKYFMGRIETEMAKYESLQGLKRKFLVSHILYELILDNMILEQAPDIVIDIYQHLDSCPKQDIQLFLEKIMQKNEAIDVFLDSYDKFILRRFLNFYSEERNLVKALHRVTGTISQWEYNEYTENDFITVIQLVKSEIDFGKTFERIKSHATNE